MFAGKLMYRIFALLCLFDERFLKNVRVHGGGRETGGIQEAAQKGTTRTGSLK